MASGDAGFDGLYREAGAAGDLADAGIVVCGRQGFQEQDALECSALDAGGDALFGVGVMSALFDFV